MSDHDKRQAGAEIEVTPEMVQAGLNYLYNSGRIDFEFSCDHLYIEDIVKTVLKAGGFPVRICEDQHQGR